MATRNISIGLLKEDVHPQQALVEEHGLTERQSNNASFEGCHIFSRSRSSGQPWWVAYLGIEEIPNLTGADCLIFLPVVNDRWAYISLGFAYHKVANEFIEHDFGMKSAAVLVDTKSLRSTDSLEPSGGRRRRTQVPRFSEVYSFGLNDRSTLVKSIVGKPKDNKGKTLKQVAGGSHLKVSTSVEQTDLRPLLDHFVDAYFNGTVPEELVDYLQMQVVNDPIIKDTLNTELIAAIGARDMDSISISVPDTIEYGTRDHVRFNCYGRGSVRDDIYIGSFYEHLEERHGSTSINLEVLSKATMIICDDEGNSPMSYPLVKSIFFETLSAHGNQTYYLSEGIWYKVANTLIGKLTERLRPFFQENSYPAFTDNLSSESEYNTILANTLDGAIKLDAQDMLPWNRSKMEPCDVLQVSGEVVKLLHVKRKTSSADLSHLLSQGINSWRAIRESDDVKARLLVLAEEAGADPDTIEELLENRNVHIEYVITTHKDPQAAELNLPIFSRLSADRLVSEALEVDIGVSFTYVFESNAPKRTGRS